jgi:hypothetical protein
MIEYAAYLCVSLLLVACGATLKLTREDHHHYPND